MGAFNTLTAATSCPDCGRSAEFEIQFKYGDTWQHSYRLGDRLRWGGNDIGTPGLKRVEVEGIGGPCPHCGREYLDFKLVVENDSVVRVEPSRQLSQKADPRAYGSWRPKLDKAAAKRITADWLSELPGFGRVKSLLLGRRVGPLFQGVLLDRESSNTRYRPCTFVHNLSRAFPALSLGLQQPLLTTRNRTPESITVGGHGERWREAAQRLKASSLLPMSGSMTLDQVLDAYRKHRMLPQSDPYDLNSFEEAIALLCWAGLQARAENFVAECVAQMRTWPSQYWSLENAREWESKARGLIQSTSAVREIAEREAERLKVAQLPFSALLIPLADAQ